MAVWPWDALILLEGDANRAISPSQVRWYLLVTHDRRGVSYKRIKASRVYRALSSETGSSSLVSLFCWAHDTQSEK